MTTTLTARQLLKMGDSTFCTMLRTWETERWCPVPLADYLREKGHESGADAAEWAAVTEERLYWTNHNETVYSRPYPTSGDTVGQMGYFWAIGSHDDYADVVPEGALTRPEDGCRLRFFPTLTDALIGLLDGWQVGTFGGGEPFKKPTGDVHDTDGPGPTPLAIGPDAG